MANKRTTRTTTRTRRPGENASFPASDVSTNKETVPIDAKTSATTKHGTKRKAGQALKNGPQLKRAKVEVCHLITMPLDIAYEVRHLLQCVLPLFVQSRPSTLDILVPQCRGHAVPVPNTKQEFVYNIDRSFIMEDSACQRCPPYTRLSRSHECGFICNAFVQQHLSSKPVNDALLSILTIFWISIAMKLCSRRISIAPGMREEWFALIVSRNGKLFDELHFSQVVN